MAAAHWKGSQNLSSKLMMMPVSRAETGSGVAAVVHRLDPQPRAFVAVFERLLGAAKIVARCVDFDFRLALGAADVHTDRPTDEAGHRKRRDTDAETVQRAQRFEAIAGSVDLVLH